MARPIVPVSSSCHGKHAPDAFRVSLYLSSEEKKTLVRKVLALSRGQMVRTHQSFRRPSSLPSFPPPGSFPPA